MIGNGHIIILVADHNFERLNVISKRLKQEGYQVLAATGGKQAIAMAMNKSPDIVILEATLDGSISDTSREIKKFNAVHALKLVIKGEVFDKNELNELSTLDIQDFIPYTVGLEEFVGRIKRVEAGKPRAEAAKFEGILSEKPGPVTGKRKILLVEDDEMNQRYIRILLDNLGYETVLCANGLEALEKIKQNGYDLVITDLNVPGLSGLELTKEIRKEYSTSLPVVGVSGHAERRFVKQCLDAGMNDYLVKPLETAQFASVLQKHLGQENAKVDISTPTSATKYNYSQLLQTCEGDERLLYKWMESYLELVKESITVLSEPVNSGMLPDDSKLFHDLLNKAAYFGTKDLAVFIKEFITVRAFDPKQEIILRFYRKITAELREVESYYRHILKNATNDRPL